jgi:hypothetical protein
MSIKILKYVFDENNQKLLSEPIKLSCGHYIYQSCIQQNDLLSKKTCNLCSKTNKLDLKLVIYPTQVNDNVYGLFNETQDHFKSLFTNIKG